MNKSDLIEAIASHANLNKIQAGQALEGITKAIESALKKRRFCIAGRLWQFRSQIAC